MKAYQKSRLTKLRKRLQQAEEDRQKAFIANAQTEGDLYRAMVAWIHAQRELSEFLFSMNELP